MVSALARVTSGDPRRPAEIVRYKRPSGEEASLDPAAYLALALGLLALVLKMKAAAWASVFVSLSSLANVKSTESDQRQVMSSIVITLFGLFASYQRHLLPIR